MDHNTDNLEHFSASQEENQEKTPYVERPLFLRILAILLTIAVLIGFLGTCYWLVMYGRM